MPFSTAERGIVWSPNTSGSGEPPPISDSNIRNTMARLNAAVPISRPITVHRFQTDVLERESIYRSLGFHHAEEARTFFTELLDTDVLQPLPPEPYRPPQQSLTREMVQAFGALATVREELSWDRGKEVDLAEVVTETRKKLGKRSDLQEVIAAPSEGIEKVADAELKSFLADQVEPYIKARIFPLGYNALYHPSIGYLLAISPSQHRAILRGLYSGYWVIKVINRPTRGWGHASKPYVNKDGLRAIATFVWQAKKEGSDFLDTIEGKAWYRIAKKAKQSLGDSVVATYLYDESPHERHMREEREWLEKHRARGF